MEFLGFCGLLVDKVSSKVKMPAFYVMELLNKKKLQYSTLPQSYVFPSFYKLRSWRWWDQNPNYTVTTCDCCTSVEHSKELFIDVEVKTEHTSCLSIMQDYHKTIPFPSISWQTCSMKLYLCQYKIYME